MRLAEFILQNIEPILVEWEDFARSIWPGDAVASPVELRNDAEKLLHETVLDMRREQSLGEQEEKSKGLTDPSPADKRFNEVSNTHGSGRATSGFLLPAVFAEYRALRASVLRLWRRSKPDPDPNDLEDITRFNEAMDQSLTHAITSFVKQFDADRVRTLEEEQASRLEAEAANRAKDLFLATLSHELRTPMTAIMGWVHILRQRAATGNDLTEGLAVIDRSAKTQMQLISDMLDVSRIVSGKLRMEIRPCNLCEIIAASVETIRPAASARDITFDLHLDTAAGAASCDGERIQQVIWNLVSNAVKFTPKGGRVAVALRREHSSVRIDVQDTGLGIDSTTLPHVFERFRQADSTSTRNFGGLGLGLAIVKHIVEGHGGSVKAFSEGTGRGSTFTVSLPVKAVMMNESPHDRATQPYIDSDFASAVPGWTITDGVLAELHDLRVLVVDDDADARRLLSKVLGDAGAQVVVAPDARAALKLLPNARPQVLVSDLGMPDMDGLELIREVRRLGYSPSQLAALALTAFVQTDDQKRALAAGFQSHVHKPVNPEDLLKAVAKLACHEG